MNKWASQFKDSRWQKKRLEIMERDKWTCRSCGKSGDGVTLNVHHAYYERGNAPWEYPNSTLITWCEDCHKLRHTLMKELATECLKLGYTGLWGLYSMASNCPKTLQVIRRCEPSYIDDSCLAATAAALLRQHRLGYEDAKA